MMKFLFVHLCVFLRRDLIFILVADQGYNFHGAIVTMMVRAIMVTSNRSAMPLHITPRVYISMFDNSNELNPLKQKQLSL